ncbi:MAG: hypothetical protein R3D81_03430 [Thalassovita sp.]
MANLLFAKTDLPRRPGSYMHVADAGHLPGGSKGIGLRCSLAATTHWLDFLMSGPSPKTIAGILPKM